MLDDSYNETFSPPGDTLQEHLDYIGMSQTELAERMGRPKEKINDIIYGREPITLPTAYQLERVLGIPADFWLAREKSYRQALYELELKKEMEKLRDWLRRFPLKEMMKRGWIATSRDTYELTDSLLKYFGVSSPDEWRKIYAAEAEFAAFRLSLHATRNPYALAAWLRKGELESMNEVLPSFDSKRLKQQFPRIRELAYYFPDDFALQLRQICRECGLLLTFTPALPHAPVSGAARWLYGKPLIQLSDRYKTDDHFWFTFFHEVGHILLHGKKRSFIEDVEGWVNDPNKEEEANRFASRTLIGDNEWNFIKKQMPFTLTKIEILASDLKIAPSIIVGRLQHERLIPFNFGNQFKRKILLFPEADTKRRRLRI